MMDKLIDWVKTSPPSWASEKIQNWEDVYQRRQGVDMLTFVTREEFEREATLDMRQVIGQWDHYAGQSWAEAALDPNYKPSKMERCFQLFDENPNYYFNGELAGGISVSSLNNGPWYSDHGGNHRTVVAKFACAFIEQKTGQYPLVRGINKHLYFANTEAWRLCTQLKQLDAGIFVTPIRSPAGETKHNNIQILNYDLVFKVVDQRFSRQGRRQDLTAAQFVQYATHVLSTQAVVSRYDWLRHYWEWWFGSTDALIY